MEDIKIIELFFNRSEYAIKELSLKYGKLCNSIAYNVLYDREDAEECENDTYLKAWNSIPPHKPLSLPAYVSKIVRNLALDKLKYYNRQKRSAEIDNLFSEMSECIPSKEDVQASADDTVIQAVNSFLKELDSQTRILFIRRYFYMERLESLALRYGLSASNISTRLNRIRQRLKCYLEKEGIIL